jgi:diacylglycerol kinase (ATP)
VSHSRIYAAAVRWTAIVNPVAGRGRTRRLRPELEAGLARRGVPFEVPDGVAGTRHAARVAFGRGDGVVVCGGDGTVAEVAGIAAECDGTIGVVPTGAGNDFARHLGIGARRPLDALGLLETGRVAACDLGRATDADGTSAWFTTVANTGFDSEANRWANGVRWATGTPLYLMAVLRTLVAYGPRELRVVVDGVALEGRAWLAAVGNSRFYAGGMMIVPGAEVDDGVLDVCVIGDVSRAAFVARFPRVFRGTHTKVDGVVTRRGAVVELDAPGAGTPLEVWAAGERVGALPARIEVVAGAVRVLVPDGAPVTGR